MIVTKSKEMDVDDSERLFKSSVRVIVVSKTMLRLFSVETERPSKVPSRTDAAALATVKAARGVTLNEIVVVVVVAGNVNNVTGAVCDFCSMPGGLLGVSMEDVLFAGKRFHTVIPERELVRKEPAFES